MADRECLGPRPCADGLDIGLIAVGDELALALNQAYTAQKKRAWNSYPLIPVLDDDKPCCALPLATCSPVAH